MQYKYMLNICQILQFFEFAQQFKDLSNLAAGALKIRLNGCLWECYSLHGVTLGRPI